MFDLYSRRKKDVEDTKDIFIYDIFPPTFRNQFYWIVEDVFSKVEKQNYQWGDIEHLLCEKFAREKGMKYVSGYFDGSENVIGDFEYYIDKCSEEDFLDLLDFIYGAFISNEKIQSQCYTGDDDFFKNAIDELNLRLKQHRLGYEFVNNEIIVKTNTIMHHHVIKPALKLLIDEEFRGAEEEYLLAFEHFRKSENKDAILNAIKAFESTLKTICSGMGYTFDKDRDTAKKLISILENNSFYPTYLNNHITGIRSTLESGAPTLRNKKAGHGQGVAITTVTDEYVEYALNLVATNMIFLYKLYKEKKLEATTK